MKNIAGKLIKIMDECGIVKKNGLNEFHKYKYATSADVLEKVNASLVKHNVASIVTPEIISITDVVNNKGNTEHLAAVKVTITLIDSESGESVTISGLGSGQDPGDKFIMKAETAAIKYAYLLSLAISANDDPEADRRTDEDNCDRATENNSKINRTNVCSDCGVNITAGIISVSTNKFGRPLCMKCQKKVQTVA